MNVYGSEVEGPDVRSRQLVEWESMVKLYMREESERRRGS